MGSIAHRATGDLLATVEYNDDRSIAAIHWEHTGGDIIAISQELLHDADLRFLKCHDGVIECCGVGDAPVLVYEVIDQDDVCVLARRKESGAAS